MARPWWQWGSVYQIYPRSFADSNGDGIGDLPGITAKLDYLAWLGVDAIWLSPIFPSPMADFGYDVADYTGVDPIFGDLQDLDVLLEQAHRRGLRVLLDLVPNHTSDRHPWFVEARSSRDNPKRAFYLWHDARPGGGPPNNWLSVFGGSAWEWDAVTGQYYYHAFLKEQPDLDWRNPEVRSAIYSAMRFWLDRGVDGFRVDVLWHLIKDARLRDNPVDPDWQPGMNPYRALLATYSTDQPETMDIVHEMRAVLDEYQDRVLIGEIYLPVRRLVAYYGENGRGAQLPFNFQLLLLPWEARRIAAAIDEYEALLPAGAWPNWVLGNHDQRRIASRVGAAQARVAAMLLLTLRGTPTLYYGDELGMHDAVIPPELEQDPQGRNLPGLGLSRDPARTPMHWNAAPDAGFGSARPWLPIPDDHRTLNVDTESREPDSSLNLYRELLALRRREPALHAGSYSPVPCSGHSIAYLREAYGVRFLVALNLGSEPATIDLAELGGGRVVLSTLPGRRRVQAPASALELAGDEGVIVRLDSSAPSLARTLAGLAGLDELGSVLIVAAHPDDDVIGAGGLLYEIGPRARIVYVTDGSPADAGWAHAAGFDSRAALAAARRAEALAALAVAGVPASAVRSLGIVDQNTLHELVTASAALERLIDELAPSLVLTHPYEGAHPDHDASALAVHAALRRLERAGRDAPPLLEFASYHARGGALVVGDFLARGTEHVGFELTAPQQAAKRRMFECHRSQAHVLQEFGFGVTHEAYRVAPRYDFSRPAQDELIYERFCPGMDAQRWRDCTLPLLAALGLTS